MLLFICAIVNKIVFLLFVHYFLFYLFVFTKDQVLSFRDAVFFYSSLTIVLLFQMQALVERLKQTMTSKEQELNNFKEKFNIRMGGDKENNPNSSSQNADKSAGVLVAQDKA